MIKLLSLLSLFRKKKAVDTILTTKENIPKHIAIIPDGNGRWAKNRGLPRTAGHAEGIKRIREIIRKSNELGIEVLTLYTFSTENWGRTQSEVDYLMKAPVYFLSTDLPKLIKKNVRVKILGEKSKIPLKTRNALLEFERKTKDCTGMILNFAFNYGSRDEIVQAVQHLLKEVQNDKIATDEINEEAISRHLFTRDLSDPDLLIRTSGEKRISNFMLWQLVYTELWFTDVLWPDFTVDLFESAIYDFQLRQRRYGAY